MILWKPENLTIVAGNMNKRTIVAGNMNKRTIRKTIINKVWEPVNMQDVIVSYWGKLIDI